MVKIRIRGQALPNWVELELQHSSVYLRDLMIRELHDSGWTLAAIAKAAKLSRERIRQVCSRLSALPLPSHPIGLPLPMPPVVPEPPKQNYVEPSKWVLERLLELKPLAMKVRSNSNRFRKEAEEYTALINHAHKVEGVTLYRLAKRLGVSHGALRFRLARYGYLESAGKSHVYTPVIETNRYGN